MFDDDGMDDFIAGAVQVAAGLRRGRDRLQECAALARAITHDMHWQSRAVRDLHATIQQLSFDLTALAAMAEEAAVAVVYDAREHYRMLAQAFGS